MKNQIYTELKEDIITCKYPPKYIIEEKFLTDKYKVSRTPVREIMNVLKQEGWLEDNPHKKGLRVSAINLKGVKDLFQLRYELEPMILKLSFSNIDRNTFLEQKNHIIQYRDSMDIDKLVEMDTVFHNEILMCSNNQLVIKFVANIMEQIERLRYLTNENKEEVLKSANAHIAIIDCVLNNDLEHAQQILQQHIDSNQIYFFRNMVL